MWFVFERLETGGVYQSGDMWMVGAGQVRAGLGTHTATGSDL